MFNEDGPSVFTITPVERAGDIMNFAQSEIRERLMEDFGKTDPDTAERIRKVMFTFADIPDRVQPRDVSAITRTVDPEILLRALKNAPPEAAMNELILGIRKLESSDEITLITEDEID